jgi:hypothetical protein
MSVMTTRPVSLKVGYMDRTAQKLAGSPFNAFRDAIRASFDDKKEEVDGFKLRPEGNEKLTEILEEASWIVDSTKEVVDQLDVETLKSWIEDKTISFALKLVMHIICLQVKKYFAKNPNAAMRTMELGLRTLFMNREVDERIAGGDSTNLSNLYIMGIHRALISFECYTADKMEVDIPPSSATGTDEKVAATPAIVTATLRSEGVVSATHTPHEPTIPTATLGGAPTTGDPPEFVPPATKVDDVIATVALPTVAAAVSNGGVAMAVGSGTNVGGKRALDADPGGQNRKAEGKKAKPDNVLEIFEWISNIFSAKLDGDTAFAWSTIFARTVEMLAEDHQNAALLHIHTRVGAFYSFVETSFGDVNKDVTPEAEDLYYRAAKVVFENEDITKVLMPMLFVQQELEKLMQAHFGEICRD